MLCSTFFSGAGFAYQNSQVAAEAPAGHQDSSAVILMYHHVSAETPALTSVTPERFKQHIQYLADNEFTVWPLYRTLMHLVTGRAIPPRTVVLTFDDAYRSVYTEAFPVLKERGWPFTVFVTARYISSDYANYMDWDQLREIKKYGGEIGNHSLTHPHLVRKRSAETDAEWRERIMNEITQTQEILREHVGRPIWAIAYPYGEYSKEVKKIVREVGYFGIGQQSGAVSQVTDFLAVPRFPMATGYDDMENFAIKVATKNLPLTVLSPDDGILSSQTEIPVLQLRLEQGDYKKERLACYATGQGRIQIEWLDNNNQIFNVRANETIKPGRTKYTCTAPSASQDDVFYWFSYLWMKPEPDGSWYRE
jgi:biofilm PGA synthesis lipoprotein PgaB